jgi:phosphatidylglycerol---prolipoprotein diacylglyceryl transferase
MLFAIPFPMIDPVAIQIGQIAIRWYALAYVAGIIIGWRYARALAAQRLSPLTPLMVDDFVTWAVLAIVLGGRIGYVLFYNLNFYIQHPSETVFLWHGGMSFHGGLIGVVTAMALFVRKRGIRFFHLTDVVAAVTPIGLFFGRIANFINGELFGRETDVPWGMVFPNGGPNPRHPSQLYEAILEGLVLFIVLAVIAWRYKGLARPGLISGAFFIGYAFCRIAVEFVRQPDQQVGFLIGGATMGQLLSLPMIAFGIAFIWLSRRKKP